MAEEGLPNSENLYKMADKLLNKRDVTFNLFHAVLCNLLLLRPLGECGFYLATKPRMVHVNHLRYAGQKNKTKTIRI